MPDGISLLPPCRFTNPLYIPPAYAKPQPPIHHRLEPVIPDETPFLWPFHFSTLKNLSVLVDTTSTSPHRNDLKLNRKSCRFPDVLLEFVALHGTAYDVVEDIEVWEEPEDQRIRRRGKARCGLRGGFRGSMWSGCRRGGC